MPFVAGARCPCFTQDEVDRAVTAAARYDLVRFEGADRAGNICRAMRLSAADFEFLAAGKAGALELACPVERFYPVISLVPNGCYKRLAANDVELFIDIRPEEGLACHGVLERYRQ